MARGTIAREEMIWKWVNLGIYHYSNVAIVQCTNELIRQLTFILKRSSGGCRN